MNRTVMWLAIALAVATAPPASAKSKAQICKTQCGGLIDACSRATGTLGFGDLAKSCRQSVLKRCKKEGAAACAAFCGNGGVEGDEQCDGSALGGATCESLGFASGTLACAIGCRFDTSGCVPVPAKLCGNGVKDEGEDCDGSDLGGSDCTTLGLPSGELACDHDCVFDPHACDFPPQPAGPSATLVGGYSYWQDFTSNDPNGFVVGDGALIPRRKDAFDRFWAMRIDGTVVNPGASMTFTGGEVRGSLTAPPVTISGLQVSQRYTTFQSTSVLRVMLTLTNATGAPVLVTARATGNFGSDGGTTIAGTSNGDTNATTLDRWIATFDSTPDSNDPGIVTVFGGPDTAAATPSTVTLTADEFAVEFPVTVPADSTRRLLFFSGLVFDGSGAASSGELFGNLALMRRLGLFGGMTAAEQAEVANWNLAP